MRTVLEPIVRTSTFVGKELVEILRRPGAFIGLAIGPFLIMAVFGMGYSGVRRPMETVLVIPEDARLTRDAAYYQDLLGPAFHVREVTAEDGPAEESLRRQQLDLVIVAPANAATEFRSGRQAEILVEYNQVDPILDNYLQFLSYRLSQEVNREVITQAVEEGEDYAVGRGAVEAGRIPPEVIAEPTRATARNFAQSTPNVVSFYGPAVFALIIQHLAVTLTALSLVRERRSGAMELFRVAPVGALEIVIGKYVAFAIVSAAIAAVVAGPMVGLLGVPFLGDLGLFVLVVALLALASIGLGLLISAVSDSERQAVQLSLLVLLASVFFSGFVLPIAEFIEPVRIAAHALPVTHGIRLLQDVMLRGVTYVPWMIGVLALLAVGLFVLTTALVRRLMARGG